MFSYKPNQNNEFYFVLYVLFFLLLVYAFFDFRTSANTFVRVGVRSSVHMTLFFIMSLTGLYFIFTSWKEIKISSFKTLLWLIAGWIATAIIYHGTFDWNAAIHLGLSCMWILIYHFFSYHIRRFPKSFTQVQICMGMMFAFYIFSAVYAMFFIHAHLVSVGEDRLAVVNLAYNAIVFVPYISLLESKKLRIIGYGIVLMVVLGSMKRGAIIVYPLMLIVWMLADNNVNKKGYLLPLFRIILMLIIFVAGLIVADHFSDGFLSQRFSSKQLLDGSGRAGAFDLALKQMSGWTLDDFVLGTGQGFFSHNDWFEFLYRYGIIGVLLYFSLLTSLAGQVWQLINRSSRYAPSVAMVFVYFIMVGMFGAVYFVHSTLYIMAFLGVVEGLAVKESHIVRNASFKV